MVRVCTARLTRLTRREDVTGDLMQELVIRLCRSRGLERAGDPFAYAYRSAANLAFEWRRSQRAFRRPDSRKHDPPSVPSPLGAAMDGEELERVLDATAGLREPARDAVILRYIEQMSYEEIALRLGKKPQHVRSILSKALAQLRALLGDDGNGQVDGG